MCGAVARSLGKPQEFGFCRDAEHHGASEQAAGVEGGNGLLQISDRLRRYVGDLFANQSEKRAGIVEPVRALSGERLLAKVAEPKERPLRVGIVQSQRDKTLSEEIPEDIAGQFGVIGMHPLAREGTLNQFTPA